VHVPQYHVIAMFYQRVSHPLSEIYTQYTWLVKSWFPFCPQLAWWLTYKIIIQKVFNISQTFKESQFSFN
jgi:hypothetical protein